jgi:hypothetical protein
MAVTGEVTARFGPRSPDNLPIWSIDVPQLQDVEALFRLSLNEFTSARNALADRVKETGRAEVSARIRALAKPPLSAWVVNQLYWRHRDVFDRLIAAGARLRRAQASQLRGRGGDLREPLDARRTAMAELTRLAMAIAREAGNVASPALLRRVTATLDALATYAGDPSGPTAGQLTADVDSPGFEALSTLIPAGAGHANRRTDSHVLPFKKEARARAAAPRDPAAEKRQRRQNAAQKAPPRPRRCAPLSARSRQRARVPHGRRRISRMPRLASRTRNG